jgi:glycosyltransferase involved in cell wall biosynthesis
MKALFIHDHVFYTLGSKHYSKGGLPASTWNKYLKHFSQLTVIARGKKVDDIEGGLILSSTENVIFNLFYSVKGGLDYFKKKKYIRAQLLLAINQSDVIFIRLPSSIGLLAVNICRKINKPYVTEVVGCAWDSIWNYGTILHKIYAPFAYYKMKKAVKNSVAAHYVTQFFLQKRYPMSKIEVFASNVVLHDVSDNVLQNKINYINRKDGIYKIGIIGNLSVHYKGYDTAFKALSLLKNAEVKFQFYLVGGGNPDYVNRLMQKYNLTKESIIVGALEAGEAIFNFLDELDIYIHPSRQEGLPRAVIEAMSRACPVIASNIAGIPELLPIEYMHRPKDYKSLFKKIYIVLKNKNQMVEMANQNYIRSKEYRIDILSKRLDKFYRQISDLKFTE